MGEKGVRSIVNLSEVREPGVRTSRLGRPLRVSRLRPVSRRGAGS